MSKIWKRSAILALVLSVAAVGTVLTAQEHQDEATQEETEHDMGAMHEMDSSHDMGSMMAMMKKMMVNMHEHMAMMHTMMAGKHGSMQGKHGEGMHKMQGEGMQGMMRMLDPAGIEDAAEAAAAADKVAEHLEMMQQMMPKLEAQLEALRKRAEELSANES